MGGGYSSLFAELENYMLNFKSSGAVHSEAHPWILMADGVYLLIVLLEEHIILSCLEN